MRNTRSFISWNAVTLPLLRVVGILMICSGGGGGGGSSENDSTLWPFVFFGGGLRVGGSGSGSGSGRSLPIMMGVVDAIDASSSSAFPFFSNFEDGTTTTTSENDKKRKEKKRHFRFALCPKSIDNPFFDLSRDGCVDRARTLSTAAGTTTTTAATTVATNGNGGNSSSSIVGLVNDTLDDGGGLQNNTIIVDQNDNNDIFDNGDDANIDDDISIECLYIGPNEFNPDGIEQAQIILDLILNNNDNKNPIDGLSISITNPIPMLPVIQLAISKGIPVVTFDSDDPNSGRASYIGTDNYFFGEQLGKVLKQIQPNGGNFVIVSDPTPNIIDRENGVRDSLLLHGDNQWTELTQYSPINMQGNNSLAIDQMRFVAKDSIKKSAGNINSNSSDTANTLTAIIPVMGGPMFLPTRWKELVDEFRDITFVVADGLIVQLELLSRGYVHGLIAQLPYEMGVLSIDSLYKLATTTTTPSVSSEGEESTQQGQVQEPILEDFQGTNVLYHLQVPLVLPELNVNENYLGKLSILGYTLFAIVCSTSLFFGYWTYTHRAVHVVRAAQPEFLLMIVVGTLLLSSAIIPLSFDDSGTNYQPWHGKLFCMSIPWLTFCGFTIIFTALFAKTWRVNQLFQAQRTFQRITVSYKEVGYIFVLLFGSNVIVLLCWTILNPLEYVRKDGEGLDAWGRIISTYGTCEAISGDHNNEDGSASSPSSSRPYLIVLGLINVGVLGIANWQAYAARKIEVELSESQYISIAVGSLLQAGLIGTPLLVLVNDLPQAFYLTMVFMLFIVPMVILLLIFVPKYNNSKRSASSQLFLVKNAVQSSQENMSLRNSGTETDSKRRLAEERRNYNVRFTPNLPNQAEPLDSSVAMPNSTLNTPISHVSMGTSLVMESVDEDTAKQHTKEEQPDKLGQQEQPTARQGLGGPPSTTASCNEASMPNVDVVPEMPQHLPDVHNSTAPAIQIADEVS